MEQDYRNRELIYAACANMGTQLDLLSEAILLQRQLKEIEDQMAENRREVKSERTLPGEVSAFEHRFQHLQGLHNTVSTRKAWIDAQIVGPDQLLEFLRMVETFTHKAIEDYQYLWGRGDQVKNG